MHICESAEKNKQAGSTSAWREQTALYLHLQIQRKEDYIVLFWQEPWHK